MHYHTFCEHLTNALPPKPLKNSYKKPRARKKCPILGQNPVPNGKFPNCLSSVHVTHLCGMQCRGGCRWLNPSKLCISHARHKHLAALPTEWQATKSNAAEQEPCVVDTTTFWESAKVSAQTALRLQRSYF